MVYGDYSRPAPQADILAAVSSGAVDVAFIWGPVAGYFAGRAPVDLAIRPLPSEDEASGLPMAFAVSMGVRRRDEELKGEVERALEKNRRPIREILGRYHVPLVASAPPPPEDDD